MSTAPISSDRADEQVEKMVDRGTAFARVEDAIDAAALSSDHKGALWLLAWSLREPEAQRRDARLMAAAFAADGFGRPRLRAVPDFNPPAQA
jgi:hypothetical protein